MVARRRGEASGEAGSRSHQRQPRQSSGRDAGAAAELCGGETVVGRDSVVGSSVWLTHSIEPNTTVTLEKPQLRMKAKNGSGHKIDSSE